jgi:hypothetical protein
MNEVEKNRSRCITTIIEIKAGVSVKVRICAASSRSVRTTGRGACVYPGRQAPHLRVLRFPPGFQCFVADACKGLSGNRSLQGKDRQDGYDPPCVCFHGSGPKRTCPRYDKA